MATTLPDPQFSVLVTGGAGFIGSNLVDHIPSRFPVVVLDNLMRTWESFRNLREINRPFELVIGDVRDEALVKRVVRDYRPGVIYHLAALPSHRLALTKPPLDYVTVDVLGTLHVLDAAREYGGRVVFASSNKVYGHQAIPHSEGMLMKPEGPYGMAKAVSEGYCQQYANYYGVDSVAIRFHHAIGPRCHSELVLPIFVECALRDQPLVVNGRVEGLAWKSCAADFTYVGDVIRGLLLFMHPNQWPLTPSFRFYNFGTGRITTVLRLAELVLEYLPDSLSPIKIGEAMPHEGLEHLAVVDKARNELGWEAYIEVEESVRRYVEWRNSRSELIPHA